MATAPTAPPRASDELDLAAPRPPVGGRLRDLLASGAVETVLLAAVDVQGRLKGKAYDPAVLLERVSSPEMCGYVFDTDLGMSADGGALASWGNGFGDVALLPDFATARLLPWLPRTALVSASPMFGGWPLPVAPTTLLDEQLTLLAGHGLSLKAGIETEFVVYEGTARDAATAVYQGLRPVTWDNRDYALDQPARLADFTRRIRQALAGAGMPMEAVKLESGPGQVEVTFPYGDVTAACLQHVLFKHATRAVAEECGLASTFMAAPATGVGSGLHVHISLYRDDEPVLGSGRDDTTLSELGEQAVAGLLKVLPQTTPMWAPYVNSYKRLADHSFAPTRFTWGRDNRSCAVRVVGHGRGLHLEVRLPGADANPYLTMAAVLAGIRHGIEARLKPPQASTGDAYRNAAAPPVPAHLTSALDVFEGSALAAELLGSEKVAHLAAIARLDLAHHSAVVTDAELVRGFAQA